MSVLHLSDLLSKLLVGLTIEIDNLHESRMAATWARPFKASFVMWSNFLRYVDPAGTRVDDLALASCLSRPLLGSTVGGMERWGYIAVGEDPAAGYVSPRLGYGTARGVKPDTVIYPTQTGTIAHELWAPLADEVEQRWRERLDERRVDDLRAALVPLQDPALPRFVPVVSAKGLFAAASIAAGATEADDQLTALLSRALLALTLREEEGSAVSRAIGANVLRVVQDEGTLVSSLPGLACVSKEAVALSLTWLDRAGLVEVVARPGVRGKAVSLTVAGREAQAEVARRGAGVDATVPTSVRTRLRSCLDEIIDDPEFGRGLAPPAMGWRATGRYKQLTEAFVTDPRSGLPDHPMVLHRGGWPDGS